MEQQPASGHDPVSSRDYESSPEYLREVLNYVVEIGASLRLQMDTDTLLKRIAATSCQALRCRYTVIYLFDGTSFFCVAANSGLNVAEEEYLRQHPLPAAVVARIVDEQYRLSNSYFLPAEAPIWQDKAFASYFVIVNPSSEQLMPTALSASNYMWRVEDLMIVPLRGGDGQLLGFLTPDAPLNELRPTTERMGLFELFANQAAVVIEGARLYSELRTTIWQARESERIKNNFLLTASHELRTPLTAVQGYLELLGDYGETLDDESKARFIQNARRGCDELVLLLGNVLDATHLDTGKVVFKAGTVYLAQSTRLILEILEPIITREQRPIDVQIPPDLCVWADELRLRQILLNLLGNALKYTPTGSRIALKAIRVDVEHVRAYLQRDAGEPRTLDSASNTFVVLAVRDWGPGVTPGEQAQLFTRFTRLEAARNSSQHGFGLGLYLCRQLVTAMGGAIWMESSGVPGAGAIFFVALPTGKG
ncbi:MAG: ATP-binding protein [Ktedonobacteraceae bacterium]